jgi:putative transcriptional regulator
MIEQAIEGSFLIAHPRSETHYFSKTLIYILENNSEGSLGFIVNRSAGASLGEVLDHAPDQMTNETLLIGGPVQSDCLRFLSVCTNDQLSLPPKLIPDLGAAAELGQTDDYAILPLLGYAGWDKGQLEQEISEDLWLIVTIDWMMLLSAPEAERYELGSSQLGFDPALIGLSSEHLQ